MPKLKPPTELESAPEPPSDPLTEAAEPRAATASPSPLTDDGAVAEAPGDPASPGSSPSEPASGAPSRIAGRARLRARLAADRRLRATVEELSGCLYAVGAFERRVLRLRTGLGGGKGLSRGQAARRLGAPPAGVRRAERSGVRGLQRAARTDGCGRSANAGSAGFPGGLASAVLATVERATAGEPLAALSDDLDGSRPAGDDADSGGVAGFQESGARRDTSGEREPPQINAAATTKDRDLTTWLLLVFLALVLSGLALLGSVGTRRGRHRTATSVLFGRRGPRQATEPSCAFCRSKRVAVNPTHGLYRCADCGFSGQLSGAPQAEAGKMHDASKQS